MTVVILVSLSLIVCSAAQSPGFILLSDFSFPLSPGFSAAFGVSEKVVSIFMLPISFSGLYTLMYIYGRIMCAMARSKLLPSSFALTTSNNVPYVSLIVGTSIGYSILLVCYYSIPNYYEVLSQVYCGVLMCTISVYFACCISFIVFRLRYSSLERHYVNRLGIASAIFAMSIYGFTFIAAAGFSNNYVSVKVYFGFIGVITVYYLLLARKSQTFSPEEKAVLFTAYVLKGKFLIQILMFLIIV